MKKSGKFMRDKKKINLPCNEKQSEHFLLIQSQEDASNLLCLTLFLQGGGEPFDAKINNLMFEISKQLQNKTSK